MVGDIMQPTHLLFVLLVALLVLGPKRLPEVGRTLGSGIRDFRQALSGESSDHHRSDDAEQVSSATSDLHDQSHAGVEDEIVWPEEAVGPTSYDEAVEAASPDLPTSGESEPAAERISQHEHHQAAPEFHDAGAEPAQESGAPSGHAEEPNSVGARVVEPGDVVAHSTEPDTDTAPVQSLSEPRTGSDD
jgi:TatA/E family protein of Tat protein translocase